MELLIYCENLNPRTEFALSIIFKCLSQASYNITTQKDEYLSHQGPKLNYSNTELSGGLHIAASPLLSQKGISDIDVNAGEAHGKTVLFHNGKSGQFKYDALAAIFYMVSRYEEYLSFSPDEHGRFPIGESLAYKLKFHNKALVHDWAEDIIIAIEILYPAWKAARNSYTFQPTFDIDNAYAYINKTPLKTFGGLVKSLMRSENIGHRLEVLAGISADPYDNYEFIAEISKSALNKPIFFHLMASGERYDRNIKPAGKAFRILIQKLGDIGLNGLHPSYSSDSEAGKIELEAELLRGITDSEIALSRQHFLKLSFPKTYRSLMKAGINKDYSMGYAEDCGFRAGISRPFPFYDLKAEKICDFMVHPFQVMDSALNYYRKCKPAEAITEITSIINEVKRVKGNFIPVWHNESLSERNPWQGWRDVFREMYQSAAH